MAQYQHIKVFQDFYSFSLKLLDSLRRFPQLFKFTLATEIQKNVYNILYLIIKSNATLLKKEYLAQAVFQGELLQVQLRLSKDLQCFHNLSVYAHLSSELVCILKQLEGWKKSSK